MKISNMNYNGKAVKNQFIILDDNKIIFQSYGSKVAIFEKNENFNYLILCGNVWDYSDTTRKYFKEFINKYTSMVYLNKDDWLKEIETNDLIEVV